MAKDNISEEKKRALEAAMGQIAYALIFAFVFPSFKNIIAKYL